MNMPANNNQPAVNPSDTDDRLAALISNAAAIRSVASAVEGTLGPKGLNCMLVDRFGDVVVTNDGSTILDRVDAPHPAAGMLIKTAKAQDEEVGDGTTTAAVIAGALIAEGVSQALRGVPVTKIIEGIRLGVKRADEFIRNSAIEIETFDNRLLWQAAYISSRENADIADLTLKAAELVGIEKLRDPAFRLSRTIIAKENAENEVFEGIIVDKKRANRQMPRTVEKAKTLLIDDALEPEPLEDDALGTESGFARYIQLQNEYKENIERIIGLGVKFVAVAKGIDDYAEEAFTEAGIMAIQRVSSKDIAAIAEHSGARTLKRTGLRKGPDELARNLGFCGKISEDSRLEFIRIEHGAGKPAASVIVGASTPEVRDERERIAKDAASAVQAALNGGVVPGGGAIEIAASREVSLLRDSVRGMAAYGVDCVVEALRKPLMQISANAGFNPLEKVEDALSAQSKGSPSFAIDCDTGEVADMMALGIVDPAKVKLHALKAAAEIAEAILRINVIIRKRGEENPAASA